jgi:hypothetical protein
MGRWSIQDACDKARTAIYGLTHPNEPWLPKAAIELLDQCIQPESVGFQWGAGPGTLWLAERVAALITIESNTTTFDRTQRLLREAKHDNVTLLLHGEEAYGYRAAAKDLDDSLLDFAIVAGHHRDACCQIILPKIRPGGILVIDNAERFFPSDSSTPGALAPDASPASAPWRFVQGHLASWKCTWTSDGRRDTALWQKPLD